MSTSRATPFLAPTSKTGSSAQRWDLSRMPDLRGRVAIVTGANIGFHMAYQLALKGAKVYIGARSQEKADGAIKDMKEKAPNPDSLNLDVCIADLSDIKQVAKAAKRFAIQETRLDIFIHNAGIMIADYKQDEDGVSTQFKVNHLAGFTVVRELLPLLKRTALDNPTWDVRVVMVSSEGHRYLPHQPRYRHVEDFNVLKDDKTEEGGRRRYGYSKLAGILFARQLQKKMDEEGIPLVSLSIHPGRVMTVGAYEYLGKDGVQAVAGMITVEEGALTALFAATDPIVRQEKDKYGGAYLVPYGTIDEVAEPAKDEKLAIELWEASERVVVQLLSQSA